MIEDWRKDYNRARPHRAQGMMAPAAFAASLREPSRHPQQLRLRKGSSGSAAYHRRRRPTASRIQTARRQNPAEDITPSCASRQPVADQPHQQPPSSRSRWTHERAPLRPVRPSQLELTPACGRLKARADAVSTKRGRSPCRRRTSRSQSSDPTIAFAAADRPLSIGEPTNEIVRARQSGDAPLAGCRADARVCRVGRLPMRLGPPPASARSARARPDLAPAGGRLQSVAAFGSHARQESRVCSCVGTKQRSCR